MTQVAQVSVQSAPVSKTITLEVASQSSSINVVSVGPLPGSTMSKDDVPMNVQTASAKDLDESGAMDLSDFMNRRLTGVYVNNNQENPFQPDVNYRGYTASPLLGTPEGLSVYMDGVRQNQPFGDVVAWDLIPKIAVSDMALMPGSDPVFGLNTLGAAIAVTTKDGRSAPGTSLSVNGGAFGRRAGEFEHGGSNSKGLNWYLAGNLYREDGWRVLSPSEVRQIFGKLGYTTAKTSISASFGYADNWLTGNGTQDTRFLAQKYTGVNTIPDITWNHSPSVNVNLRHTVTPGLTLSGVAYYRYVRADTTNGDLNDDSFDESVYNLSAADQAALKAAGYSGYPLTGNATTEPFPFWRCIAQGLEHSEPVEKCDGIFTNGYDKQHAWGGSGQASWLKGANNLTVGSSWDRSSLGFQQFSQFGYMNPDGVSLTPVPFFADGSTNQDGTPVDTRVDLRGVTNTFSMYATDTIHAGKKLAITISGRYNRAGIQNIDNLPPADPGVRGSLNGNYTFNRFNPAVGFVYTPMHLSSIYFAGYLEANRAPTAIELGCADPTRPCNLPNALVSDPPLKQVVARTLEAGVRSTGESKLQWHAGWFRAENSNDLLFVASEQTGFGYFTNFGKTRRQGAELSLGGRIHAFTLGGNYTYLQATYQSPQTIDGGSNSTSDGGPGQDGNINIVPGDYIPQSPKNVLKAYVYYSPIKKLDVDLDFSAIGRSFARGNENNLDQPDGVYYLGEAFSPGLWCDESGCALSGDEAFAVFHSGRQPVQSPLLYGRAVGHDSV